VMRVDLADRLEVVGHRRPDDWFAVAQRRQQATG